MGNTTLKRLGQLTHDIANYIRGESNEDLENTDPSPGQRVQEARADTLPNLSTRHESVHDLDGYVRVSVALDVPGQGADRQLPILTYRDPTHYPFSWSPPLYTIFGPNAGRAHLNSQLNIHSGSVLLTGNLAHIQGLDFRNLGRGDGTTLPNEGDLPWLPNIMDPQGVWRRHPYNLTYVPLELSRDDEGNLLMPGEVRAKVLGGYITVIDNYPTLLLWREGIPYGVNAQGALVCSESERNTVVRPFPTLTHLRQEGLPTSFNLATLANISEEAGPYQGQLLDDTLHNRCGSTRLRFNLPTSMEENPLAFVPAASVETHLASGPTTIDIPSDGQHHRPSVQLELNSPRNQLDAEVTLRNGNSSRPTDRNNLTWTRAQALVRGFVSLSRIRVGDQALELPLTLEANLRAEGTGELSHPETVGVHLVADGQVTADGNIVINQRLADLFNLPLDIPEILFFRNGPTYAMARGLDVTVSPGTHAIQIRGAASVGVGLSSIVVPLFGIRTGPISANMYLHNTDQAIVADIAAHAVLPHVAFPAPLSATLERGWLSIPHLQCWLGQGASLHNFTAGIQGDIEVGDISASVQGNHIEMGQAGLRVEGQAHVQEGLVDVSIHFDAAVPNMSLHTLETSNHSLDTRLRLDASGDLRIYDSPFEDTHGQNIVRRHIEAIGVRIPFDLSIRGLSLANNIHIHGNEDTMVDGSPTRLGHAMIPAGVQITSDLHPGEALVGRYSHMTINRQVSNLIISTPLGRFRVSGQLVGQSDLVNISQDPRHPQLRPVVGRMHFEVRNGILANEQGHALFRDRTFRIRDNGRGQITVSDANQISLNGIPESIRNLFWLPESVSNVLEIPVVNFNAGAVRNSSVPELFSQDPVSRGTGAVSYYEPSQIHEVSIPSAVLRSVLNNMGTLVTTAQARITGLQSDHTRVSYRTRTPINRIQRHIHDEVHHVEGHVTLLDGQVETQSRGTNTNLRLRLPQLEIDVRHEINGVSYHYEGSLSPRHPIVGQANLNHLTLHIPERTHDLTGDLHVTATRPASREGQEPVTLGEGRLHVTSPLIISGRINPQRASITARVPDIHIEGRSLQRIHQDEIQIPAGANLNLHLEGFEANLEAHLPHLLQELRTRRGN